MRLASRLSQNVPQPPICRVSSRRRGTWILAAQVSWKCSPSLCLKWRVEWLDFERAVETDGRCKHRPVVERDGTLIMVNDVDMPLHSERLGRRLIDQDQIGSMEKKKREDDF